MNKKRINPYKMFYGALVPFWLLERKELSPGAKLCYARLVVFGGENGETYPSQKKLGKELGIGDRQIRRYVTELLEAELIELRTGELGDANNYYFLEHPWMTSESHVRLGGHKCPTPLDINDQQISSSNKNHHKGKEAKAKPADTSPTVMDLPCAGPAQFWHLRQSKVDEYRKTFPGIDVIAECRKARQWLLDNPTRIKKNVPAFLSRWMGNAQDRFRPPASSPPQERFAPKGPPTDGRVEISGGRISYDL